MAIKLSQELKLGQKLSPQQIQTIKLIELPIQELRQRIEKELEENPVLDDEPVRDKEDEMDETEPQRVSLSDYREDDSIPSYRLYVNNRGDDDRPVYNTFSVQESFTESLKDQLGFKPLDEHQKEVASFIIGSLDEDGYLRRDISSLVDDMAFRAGITSDEDEVLAMLKVIQEFEPAGVGARDLRECLLLQIRNLDTSASSRNAARIIDLCFEDFKARHFEKIMQKLYLTPEQFKHARDKILKLNPRPGGQNEDSYAARTQQIVPDFILEQDNNDALTLTMPRFNIPELRVSRKYAGILESAENSKDRSAKEAAIFVKQKLDAAKWFIEAVKQRQNTLMKTMQAIVDYQHDFFTCGEETALKPMVLKNIAEKTGLDISTVSRVVNSKYVETRFGIYPLKYFFSEGLANQEGEEVSTRELKKVLSDIINSENKHSPLTDDELVGVMEKKGYKLARRTVAKYRDQLNIPTARLRKEV